MSKTIVVACPKGGVGKSTTSMLLIQVLARFGKRIAVVDVDHRRRTSRWLTESGGNSELLSKVDVIDAVNEDNIQDKIDDAATSYDYVIVDTEGTASKIVILAVSRADFVIVPTQGSDMDAEEALAALGMIRAQEKTVRRGGNADYVLPHGVVFTRTSAAVRDRNLRHVEDNLIRAKVPLFSTEINERGAYKAFYSFRNTLYDLSEKDAPNVDKAIENAEAFVQEVIAAIAGKSLLPSETSIAGEKA